jgi:hypothetical protein
VPLTNREVFEHDPTKGDIPNLGVAKVKNPEDSGDWATLEWELRSFVCEGEYERGLERILDQFLSHLSQAEQPAAWVSGFFGSGKSHLMRVLEYLWRDYTLPSGASARDLAELPPDIERHLAELSTAGKRAGGLWSAAGTLGAGASGSARLAFLSVIFDAAGLPQQYAPARLAIWLKTEGRYDQVATTVGAAGRTLDHELRNLYVSPVLAQALIDAGASFGDTPAAVSTALQAQYPTVEDVSNAEMLDTFEEVLWLQSERKGKLPLTLVVLDEMQQYIGDDSAKALNVQDLVEGCSARFASQVLVVATGQAALAANPTLQKLIDRFTVTVALSDTDVETVVRKVVLRKKPDAHAAIEDVLAKSSGEIDRHLGGTRLAAKAADKADLVADYPLLPTRRRFWERALRAIDKAGKAGVLRTQLKIVHEAARTVADRPLGHVIGGDFVFHSEAASMLASGALLKEIDELIRGLDDGTPDGTLKSRACALVFLVSELPTDGVGDTGLRATAPAIEDLLVEDLVADGARLRKDVARVLNELADEGRVVKLGDEYRLQTEEGALWTKDYNQRRAAVRDDAARISQLRSEWLTKLLDKELAGIKLVHGNSKVTRKFDRHTGDAAPGGTGANIPVWIRDEWNVTEASVRAAAAAAGTEGSIVFVLLPKLDSEAIRDALASHAAATDAIDQRPEPQTDEGRQAKQGMQSRIQQSDERLNVLFGNVISRASVFQGGGNELTTGTLRTGIEAAGGHSLARLFPKFKTADHPGWEKVITKARDGAADSLASIGWTGSVPANPVCKEVLARITGGGTKGSDLHRDLAEPPYGWPKDALDGAVLALLANGNIRATQNGQPVGGPKELPRTQVGKTVFFKEDDPPSTTERLAVRGLLQKTAVPYTPDQEGAAISGLLQHLVELAHNAGGPAPLPAPPNIDHLTDLAALVGNEQFRAVAAAAGPLQHDLADWTKSSEHRATRETAWAKLSRLLAHADGIPAAEDVHTQRQAILDSRLLLADPDPMAPLIAKLGDALRLAVVAAAEEAQAAQAAAVTELEESDEWQKLDPAARDALLVGAGLNPIAPPAVATDDDLLQALDFVSLPSWRERCQALPAKPAAVRAAAAKQLEPKSVALKPPNATIRTPGDVEAYLVQLRQILMRHVDAEETVIL